LTATLRREDKDKASNCVEKYRKNIVNACFVFLADYPPVNRNDVVWVDFLIGTGVDDGDAVLYYTNNTTGEE
jgi:hypothetical protein